MRDNRLEPAPKRPRVVDLDVEQDLRERLRVQVAENLRLKVFGERSKNVEEENKNIQKEKNKIEEEKKKMEEEKKKMEEEKKKM